MSMAYAYGDKRTSFNGVYVWLQRRIKLPRDTNKQVSIVGQICRDYLISENLPVKMKKDFWSIDKNCKTVQDTFQKFTRFVLNNDNYEKL